MTKVIVAFRNFEKAPEDEQKYIYNFNEEVPLLQKLSKSSRLRYRAVFLRLGSAEPQGYTEHRLEFRKK
jgi:hypothetical protein